MNPGVIFIVLSYNTGECFTQDGRSEVWTWLIFVPLLFDNLMYIFFLLSKTWNFKLISLFALCQFVLLLWFLKKNFFINVQLSLTSWRIFTLLPTVSSVWNFLSVHGLGFRQRQFQFSTVQLNLNPYPDTLIYLLLLNCTGNSLHFVSFNVFWFSDHARTWIFYNYGNIKTWHTYCSGLETVLAFLSILDLPVCSFSAIPPEVFQFSTFL